MPLLLGTAPNQVPTNGDLGTMAFQDAAALQVGTVTATGAVTAGALTSTSLTTGATSATSVKVAGTTIVSNVNMLNASYDNVSFSIAAQETVPQAIFFSPDGKKMFVMGSSGDDINEYLLSTPWVISSAVYSTVFALGTQDSAPVGVFFRADGLKMYVIGQTNDVIYQYALTSPWSVATASYESKSLSVATYEITPTGIFFDPSGLSMYVLGNTSDGIHQYTLATAWDVSTANYYQVFSILAQDTTAQDLAFTSDGTRMFIVGTTSDAVSVYNLTTPWDIITAVFAGSFSVAAQEAAPIGIYIKPDGTKMYMVGQTNDTVYQYTIPSVEIQLTGTTSINGNATVAQDLTINGDLVLSDSTVNGVPYLNSSRVLTTGTELTFDGTNLGVAGTTPTITIKDTQSKTWAAGDKVGDLDFYSSDPSGSGPRTVARIRSFADNAGTTAAGALSFWTSAADAAATEKMWLDKAGNLGLGVTPSVWAANFKSISVANNAAFYGNTATGSLVGMSSNQYWNGVNNIYAATAVATSYQQNAGIHAWYNAPSGTAGNAITFTQAMTLDASGNLGVGTSSPTARLELTTDSLNQGIRIYRAVAGAGNGYEGVLFALNNTTGAKIDYAAITANSTIATTGSEAGSISFKTFGSGTLTEKMRIDASGNTQVSTGAMVVYAPAPAAISTTATLTNANIQAQIINTTGTTYTVTMALGTTLETLVPWSAVNLGYNFTVINTASGTITMAANTGVTTLGALTIATGVSANFRLRRTAANTFIMYRVS